MENNELKKSVLKIVHAIIQDMIKFEDFDSDSILLDEK